MANIVRAQKKSLTRQKRQPANPDPYLLGGGLGGGVAAVLAALMGKSPAIALGAGLGGALVGRGAYGIYKFLHKKSSPHLRRTKAIAGTVLPSLTGVGGIAYPAAGLYGVGKDIRQALRNRRIAKG